MRVILKPGGLFLLLAVLFVAIAIPVYVLRKDASASPPSLSTAPGPGALAKTAVPIRFAGPTNLHNWKFYTEKGAEARQETLPAQDAPAPRAYRFTIAHAGTNPWNVGLNQGVTDAALPSTGKLILHFWARSSTQSPIRVLLQRNAPPFPDSWRQDLTLTPHWRQYSFTIPGGPGYSQGEAIIALFLGAKNGTIDLAGLEARR